MNRDDRIYRIWARLVDRWLDHPDKRTPALEMRIRKWERFLERFR